MVATENVERIAKLEAAHAGEIGPLDRISSRITSFAGSPGFILFHVVWFTTWIGWNTEGPHRIDPYPFTFLTLMVSLEAIFLTSCVLISQKHMDQQAHRRAALDLQINLLAEKEMTKVLKGVIAIAEHHGLQGVCDDAESLEMAAETNIEAIAQAVDLAVQSDAAPESST
jgi:uncharacterized membrane protein